MDFSKWISAVFGLLNTLLIVFGIVKVFARQEMEWKDRDRRIIILEADMNTLKSVALEIMGVKSKLSDVIDEISRVRNRLDNFLDTQTRNQEKRT